MYLNLLEGKHDYSYHSSEQWGREDWGRGEGERKEEKSVHTKQNPPARKQQII